MTSPWHGTAHAVGIGLGALGAVRRLDRVDVEMDRAEMVGLLCEHALEGWHYRHALRVRLVPPWLPVIPGTQIHHGLGVKNGNVVGLRESRSSLLHGVGIGGVQRSPLCLSVIAVAPGDCGDQRLLARS